MAKRSTLPPSQDQKKFVQDDEAGRKTKTGSRGDKSNRGYSEDQPGHPVRTTGSMRPDQESDLSTRKNAKGRK